MHDAAVCYDIKMVFSCPKFKVSKVVNQRVLQVSGRLPLTYISLTGTTWLPWVTHVARGTPVIKVNKTSQIMTYLLFEFLNYDITLLSLKYITVFEMNTQNFPTYW